MRYREGWDDGYSLTCFAHVLAPAPAAAWIREWLLFTSKPAARYARIGGEGRVESLFCLSHTALYVRMRIFEIFYLGVRGVYCNGTLRRLGLSWFLQDAMQTARDDEPPQSAGGIDRGRLDGCYSVAGVPAGCLPWRASFCVFVVLGEPRRHHGHHVIMRDRFNDSQVWRSRIDTSLPA